MLSRGKKPNTLEADSLHERSDIKVSVEVLPITGQTEKHNVQPVQSSVTCGRCV